MVSRPNGRIIHVATHWKNSGIVDLTHVFFITQTLHTSIPDVGGYGGVNRYLLPPVRGRVGGTQHPGLRRFWPFYRGAETSSRARRPPTQSEGLWTQGGLNHLRITNMGFGKDGKGVIITETRTITLGTLGGSTGIFVGTKLATLERFRMLKSEVALTVTSVTGDEAIGLGLYLVDGDLTLAEAEAAIETQGPLGPNDQILQDTAMRPVFRVDGVIDISGAEPISGGAVNTGKFMASIKPRWTFARTKSWNWMIYNTGSGLTTGSTGIVHAKDFGVWVT